MAQYTPDQVPLAVLWKCPGCGKDRTIPLTREILSVDTIYCECCGYDDQIDFDPPVCDCGHVAWIRLSTFRR